MSTPPTETDTLRHEPGDDPQALRTLTLRFPGWRPWYGKSTGHWWALSPTRYRQRIGLIEADTPAELAARIQHIEDFHPQPDHQTAIAGPHLENPGRDTGITANEQDNETTSKGGDRDDRDDRTTAVRPRRRAH